MLLLRKQNSNFHYSAKDLSMNREKIKLSRYCISNLKASIYNLNVLALGQNFLIKFKKKSNKFSEEMILDNFEKLLELWCLIIPEC